VVSQTPLRSSKKQYSPSSGNSLIEMEEQMEEEKRRVYDSLQSKYRYLNESREKEESSIKKLEKSFQEKREHSQKRLKEDEYDRSKYSIMPYSAQAIPSHQMNFAQEHKQETLRHEDKLSREFLSDSLSAQSPFPQKNIDSAKVVKFHRLVGHEHLLSEQVEPRRQNLYDKFEVIQEVGENTMRWNKSNQDTQIFKYSDSRRSSPQKYYQSNMPVVNETSSFNYTEYVGNLKQEQQHFEDKLSNLKQKIANLKKNPVEEETRHFKQTPTMEELQQLKQRSRETYNSRNSQ